MDWADYNLLALDEEKALRQIHILLKKLDKIRKAKAEIHRRNLEMAW